jgi:hypothetical protein
MWIIPVKHSPLTKFAQINRTIHINHKSSVCITSFHNKNGSSTLIYFYSITVLVKFRAKQATMGKGGQHHAPSALPPGKSPRPVWRVRNIPPPPGFDHRTAQPVASHYTDYAIPAHLTVSRTTMEVSRICCHYYYSCRGRKNIENRWVSRQGL